MRILGKIILPNIILLLSGCTEALLDWDLENEPSDQIVIEAVLTNENRQHLIKISKPYQEQNQERDKEDIDLMNTVLDDMEDGWDQTQEAMYLNDSDDN